MNYCRRCESDYEKPGTCNCYAEDTMKWKPRVVTYPGTSPWQYPIYVPSPTFYPPLVVAPLTVGPQWWYEMKGDTVTLSVDSDGSTLRDHNGDEVQWSWT